MSKNEYHDQNLRNQFVVNAMDLGTWEWNVQTGKTDFNERWAEIVGYTLDELRPLSISTWQALAHPEDLERSNAALARHFAGEDRFYETEARFGSSSVDTLNLILHLASAGDQYRSHFPVGCWSTGKRDVWV